MYNRQSLKQILLATRGHWDRPEIRPAVRENFDKMINCRTPALGAEVFASETEEKLVYHTCKSRSCPSCGQRATLLWQREQWIALPDIPYAGIGFTMPHVLWPIFRQNRQLLHDLPALAAAVIQQWVKIRYDVRVFILVVPHTFGRHLNFNAHLHVMVSAGGLKESEGRWITPLRFDRRPLMHMWRYAVITYLRTALKKGLLASETSTEELRLFLKTQYERWWNIYVDPIRSKWHFLRYVARYVRRPPIAQHRFTEITDREVGFLTKDLKEKRVVTTHYWIKEFVDALAAHVPDRYRHQMRYFGLLAPGTKRMTSAALFVLLGQKKRPRPRRLSWRHSLRKYFGVDPLVDGRSQTMQWIGRLKPIASAGPNFCV
jgi:Putative transposase/Transposase zinc-binding domain